MKIIIIGGGATGLALANLLSEHEKITIIEKDEAKAKSIANKTSVLVIQGDGTDLAVLKEAGIEEAEAFIITTGDDKVNLMACELAKSEGVKNIISLVNSLQNEKLFTSINITSVVSVVAAKANAIKWALDNKAVTGKASKVIEESLAEDSNK
ncbi:MAG: NAD-binding protein [Nanoarchaeota archaeon]|nr:NAD-binding protein [Nanoarchaeota archaeon]